MASLRNSIRRAANRDKTQGSKQLICPKCKRAIKHSGLGSRVTCKCGYGGKVVQKERDQQ